MSLTRIASPATIALSLSAFLLILAAGCAQVPTAPQAPTEDRAAARAAQGEYAEAARLYAKAADAARGEQRNRLRLAAGEAAARAGNAEMAAELLDQVDTETLDDNQRARLRLARTEARIAGLPPEQALQEVPPPESGTPPEVAARTWELRARLMFAQDRVVEGAHALVQRNVWLLQPEQVQANDERIWTKLKNNLPEEPDLEALDRVDATTRGWVALARIGMRTWADRTALEDALIDWERRHPGHPAARTILPERFDYSPIVPGGGRMAVQEGRGLALALPLTGRFAEPAAAVRDGFLAAYYASEPPRPRLRLYDTNAIPDMAALLERARADGVGMLVGPLDKERVAELHSIDEPGMPILALNYAENGNGFPGFYQFGLAPEDEAKAAAERATRMGLRRGLALVPDNDWGSRILSTFRDALYFAGGELVDYATYRPEEQDHADSIKTVLKYRGVDEKTERTARAEHVKGDEPPAELGRRQDADFIFVAAQPAQARLIRTQLRFYRASRLPVLATSHVFTGQIDPDRDSDLDGLMFPDMPWVLAKDGDIAERRARIRRLWPDTADRFLRLYALGHDAWRIQDRLRGKEVTAGPLFTGDTGELYLQPDGEIHRSLEWAHFVHGRPVRLAEPVVNDPGL